MSIIDGKGLITWEGGLFEPDSDLLHRVQWAFAQIRAAGGTIILNEAGRPFGVPGDAKVRNASQTASGVSTVWFQWGRYERGETPSAADPRSGNTLASEHTQGIAIDCTAVDVFTTTLRAKYFPQVGLKNTISSESWHWAIRGAAQVSLAGLAATKLDNTDNTQQEEDDMKYEIGFDPNGGQYILGPQGVSAIPNQTIQLPLFQRLVKGERTFTAAEWKAIDETLNRRL
jgi:hypothetical protein